MLFLVGLLLINWALIIIGGLAIGLGIYDLLQSKHSILSNYPIASHIRYVLVDFHPEIRQYLLEDDKKQMPFSRQQRALVYQCAKNVSDTNAFGTLDNLYAHGKEWFLQSTVSEPLKNKDFRIIVGGEHCGR